MMTDSLHSHNSIHDGLRSGRHRSLLAKMPKPNARVKRSASRAPKRAKGSASRGRGKKWILVLLLALLLIPAMQVAVVRFINPPWTLPMLIEQVGAMFSSAPKPPLRYRWIDLPQMPEMFRLLRQSAPPGTRRLFADMIGRMDRVKCFASRGLVVLS